jgi:hypothetical protein
MARKKHLINVHTSTGTTAPTGASLYLGEIAVQHTPNDPGLWIKVGSDESSMDYEKFIGETEIIELIDNSEIILGSGYTYSGLPYVNSATTIANAYSALTKEMIDNETVVAAALNDLNGRVIELSGNTGGAETDPIFSSSVAAGITQTDIDKWNAAAGGGSTDPNAITGITMNGNAVSVSNRVAGLGTVITAETQLSKGTATGTGNVVTDLSVNNHQITLAKSFSAAPADQFVTLSGAAHNKITALSAGTISVSGFAHNKIIALSAATTAHTADTTVHITAAERTAWNSKVSNVQADWSTTATTDGSYIKNKPTIPTVPTSNTAFTNDAGYITGYTETDPTVPAWAKAENKPTYTASEVGAQETLVSGTNIKTINNESLLGSGNITISAGSGEANVINTVKVNRTALTPDSNKAVNITVPTTLDQISDGASRKLSDYLPLEGGSLQNTSSGDTELIVTDGYNEDYVKLAVTESGEAPHVEVFENGSGYTRFYYNKIQRDSYEDINLPSNSGTLALTSDIPASSTLVHTSGDETIAGGKSFTDGIGAANIDVYGEDAYISCVSKRGFD